MSESKPVAKPAGQLAKMEEGRAGKAEAAKPTPKSVATQITDQLDKVGRNAREAEGRRLAGVSVADLRQTTPAVVIFQAVAPTRPYPRLRVQQATVAAVATRRLAAVRSGQSAIHYDASVS